MAADMYSGATLDPSNVFGILYAEDFDNPAEPDRDNSDDKRPEPPAPAITQADVDAACAAAVEAARIQWKRDDEETRLKAVASLASALAGIREAAEKSAMTVAEATVMTILSIVAGLLPHFSREHGEGEARALLARLLPTIRSQTRINVRVHPDLVSVIRHDVAEFESDQATLIDVVAAPLEPGDVKVSWENGSMVRDSRKIMQAIQDALGELGLQQPVEAPPKKRMAYAD